MEGRKVGYLTPMALVATASVGTAAASSGIPESGGSNATIRRTLPGGLGDPLLSRLRPHPVPRAVLDALRRMSGNLSRRIDLCRQPPAQGLMTRCVQRRAETFVP